MRRSLVGDGTQDVQAARVVGDVSAEAATTFLYAL
jgi:hypothetical protein